MEITNKILRNNLSRSCWVLILSCAWLIFFICNIDYQNHDDIYFALQSRIVEGNITDLVSKTAQDQGRIQAYVNMPIVFMLYKIYGTFWFKLINSASVLGVIFSIYFYLSEFRDRAESQIVLALTLLLYPLHYYFMNFQGYPIIFNLGIMAAFIAPQLICDGDKLIIKLLGWLVFVFALLGPEYMVIIGAFLMTLKVYASSKCRSEKRKYIFTAIAIVFIYAEIYFQYKSTMQIVANDNGRTQAEFSLLNIFNTFWTLFKNSFVMIGLIDGIPSRFGYGSYNKYLNIDYSYIFNSVGYINTLLVFLISFVLVSAIMGLATRYSIKRIGLEHMLGVIFISCIPCLFLSFSQNYQKLAAANVLLGHPASLFLIIGLPYLAILVLQRIRNLIDNLSVAKHIPSFVISLILTMTFLYNHTNKNLLHENSIKWLVMDSYATALKSGLCNNPRIVKFDQLWQSYGVSDIPDDVQYPNSNYWTEYLHYISGVRGLNILKESNTDYYISANYICNGFSCKLYFNKNNVQLPDYECTVDI